MLTLSEIFRTQLIPWSQQNARERFIVAQPKMYQADMPYGVRLVPHKIQSKRVIVKGRRCYNNVRNIIAEWPEDGLQELGKYQLVCVLDGFVDYQVADYKLQCGPGYFIFIPPGLPRPNGERSYLDLQKGTSCNVVSFLLHTDALEFWLSNSTAQGRERSNNCLVLHERAVCLFKTLMEEVLGGESKSLLMGEGLLHVFFMLLQREIDAGSFQSLRPLDRSKIETIKALPGDFLGHLESYVQTNLRIPLTLETVSAEMHFSRAQFTRVVRRETGKSFNEFLSERRVEEAKKLLLNSQWTVTTVAMFVGFKSASHFRTFFKRHVGLTPMEFRARGLQPRDT
ncbi:MAG: AraC family transcriptional regulator [Abditibacteriaceae bacterium]